MKRLPARTTQPAKQTATRKPPTVIPEPEPEPRPQPTTLQGVLEPATLRSFKLGDNREIRIMRIPTGTSESLLRIGVNLPTGEILGGVVFPETSKTELIRALRDV